MVVRDLGFIVFLSIVVVVATTGWISSKWLGHDNFIEESMETILEDMIEEALSLPDDYLDGRIDLTPSSKEE